MWTGAAKRSPATLSRSAERKAAVDEKRSEFLDADVRVADKFAVGSIVSEDRSQPKPDIQNKPLQFWLCELCCPSSNEPKEFCATIAERRKL